MFFGKFRSRIFTFVTYSPPFYHLFHNISQVIHNSRGGIFFLIRGKLKQTFYPLIESKKLVFSVIIRITIENLPKVFQKTADII